MIDPWPHWFGDTPLTKELAGVLQEAEARASCTDMARDEGALLLWSLLQKPTNLARSLLALVLPEDGSIEQVIRRLRVLDHGGLGSHRDRVPGGFLGAAREEARALGHTFIGTEHVLIAVVEHARPGLSTLLAQYGVTAERLRSTATILLRTSSSRDASPAFKAVRLTANDFPEPARASRLLRTALAMEAALSDSEHEQSLSVVIARRMGPSTPEELTALRVEWWMMTLVQARLRRASDWTPQFDWRKTLEDLVVD